MGQNADKMLIKHIVHAGMSIQKRIRSTRQGNMGCKDHVDCVDGYDKRTEQTYRNTRSGVTTT